MDTETPNVVPFAGTRQQTETANPETPKIAVRPKHVAFVMLRAVVRPDGSLIEKGLGAIQNCVQQGLQLRIFIAKEVPQAFKTWLSDEGIPPTYIFYGQKRLEDVAGEIMRQRKLFEQCMGVPVAMVIDADARTVKTLNGQGITTKLCLDGDAVPKLY